MTTDPDQIRRHIDRTRSDLSENVNALGEKVNPASIARRQTERVRGAAVSVKETVLGRASDAVDTGQHAAGAISETVPDAPSVARRAQGSPLAAGLIAFGAGLLAASALPASRAEQLAAHTVKDTAQPLVDGLTDAATQVAGNLQEPARHGLDEVTSTAADAADTIRDQATNAADDVKDHAATAKDAMQHASS